MTYMKILREFETVDSLPMLYCRKLDTLVLSDLHIGIEVVQASSGVFMPRFQTDDILKEFKKAKEITGAERVIINGDLKESFSGRNYMENEEVEKFLRKISIAFKEVILVKGNHDSAVEHRAEDFRNVKVFDDYMEEKIYFAHGHRKLDVEDAKVVVIGHEHPALELKDDVGVTEKIRCFLYREDEDLSIIVLPAYSKVAGGTSVNNVPRKRLLSPVLREKGVSDMKAVGIDREAGLFKFPEIGKL